MPGELVSGCGYSQRERTVFTGVYPGAMRYRRPLLVLESQIDNLVDRCANPDLCNIPAYQRYGLNRQSGADGTWLSGFSSA
jgi:hypothetical protein